MDAAHFSKRFNNKSDCMFSSRRAEHSISSPWKLEISNMFHGDADTHTHARTAKTDYWFGTINSVQGTVASTGLTYEHKFYKKLMERIPAFFAIRIHLKLILTAFIKRN